MDPIGVSGRCVERASDRNSQAPHGQPVQPVTSAGVPQQAVADPRLGPPEEGEWFQGPPADNPAILQNRLPQAAVLVIRPGQQQRRCPPKRPGDRGVGTAGNDPPRPSMPSQAGLCRHHENLGSKRDMVIGVSRDTAHGPVSHETCACSRGVSSPHWANTTLSRPRTPHAPDGPCDWSPRHVACGGNPCRAEWPAGDAERDPPGTAWSPPPRCEQRTTRSVPTWPPTRS